MKKLLLLSLLGMPLALQALGESAEENIQESVQLNRKKNSVFLSDEEWTQVANAFANMIDSSNERGLLDGKPFNFRMNVGSVPRVVNFNVTYGITILEEQIRKNQSQRGAPETFLALEFDEKMANEAERLKGIIGKKTFHIVNINENGSQMKAIFRKNPLQIYELIFNTFE